MSSHQQQWKREKLLGAVNFKNCLLPPQDRRNSPKVLGFISIHQACPSQDVYSPHRPEDW